MKKSLITLAALAGFSAAASADSSVTLFGILDTGIRAVKNGDGGTVKSLTNDGLATSRLGFRGEEDLGDGLKAGFWIESTLGIDAGAGGPATASPPGPSGASQGPKFFNRRTTVSLIGPFGEIRLGRDYTPTFFNPAIFDSYGSVGVGSFFNLIGGTPVPFSAATPANGSLLSTGTLGSNAGTLARADNSVSYTACRATSAASTA